MQGWGLSSSASYKPHVRPPTSQQPASVAPHAVKPFAPLLEPKPEGAQGTQAPKRPQAARQPAAQPPRPRGATRPLYPVAIPTPNPSRSPENPRTPKPTEACWRHPSPSNVVDPTGRWHATNRRAVEGAPPKKDQLHCVPLHDTRAATAAAANSVSRGSARALPQCAPSHQAAPLPPLPGVSSQPGPSATN